MSNVTNKSKKITRIHTLLTHSNWRTLKWTDQEKDLVRQIHEKNNQKDQKTFWNESHKETIIVSRTDFCVISNKKEDDRMIS